MSEKKLQTVQVVRQINAPGSVDPTPDRAAPERPKVMPLPPPVGKSGKRGWVPAKVAGFVAAVVAPSVLSAAYLWGFAQDRYVTSFSFSVRNQQEMAQQAGAMAAMAGMGGAGASDAGVVADFLSGREVIERMIVAGVDVPGILSQGADVDPIFSLAAGSRAEEVERYWRRVAHVERDPQTGIVRFSVRAASRDGAMTLASSAMGQADRLVNELSERAATDATRVSAAETARAEGRVLRARDALAAFRREKLVVDPAREFEARMSVVTGMRQKLADALIARAGVMETSSSGPRDVRAENLDVQIRNLRAAIADEESRTGAEGGYALIASEYESLSADLMFTDEAWRAAIAREDAARQEAESQRAYLAVHSEPREAGMSVTPNRPLLLALVAGGALVLWSFVSLLVAGMRGRR